MTCHDEQSAPVATDLRRFVLVGSPNCGKTTLFNALTGLRAKTGNYPGVTVSRYEGVHKLGDVEAIIEDLPGTYSLDPISPDEEVVTEVLDAGESVHSPISGHVVLQEVSIAHSGKLSSCDMVAIGTALVP